MTFPIGIQRATITITGALKGKKRHDDLVTHAQRGCAVLVAGRRYPCGAPSGLAPAPRSAGGCAGGAAAARRRHANRPHRFHPPRATEGYWVKPGPGYA